MTRISFLGLTLFVLTIMPKSADAQQSWKKDINHNEYFDPLNPFNLDIYQDGFTYEYETEWEHPRWKRNTLHDTIPNLEPYYEGCFDSKGCIGLGGKNVNSCIQKQKDCKYLVTWKILGNDYIYFQIIAREIKSQDSHHCKPDDDPYVAIGFSLDSNKNNLLVVECARIKVKKKSRNLDAPNNSNTNTTTTSSTGNSSANSKEVSVGQSKEATKNTTNTSSQDEATSTNSTQDTQEDNGSGSRRKRNDKQEGDNKSNPPAESEGSGSSSNSLSSSPKGGNKTKSSRSQGSSSSSSSGGESSPSQSQSGGSSESEPDLQPGGTYADNVQEEEKKKKQKKHKKKHKKKKKVVKDSQTSKAEGRQFDSGGSDDRIETESYIHIGWSSEKSFKRYGTGCQNTTNSTGTEKIRNCNFTRYKLDTIICQFELQHRIIMKEDVYNFLKFKLFLFLISGCRSDMPTYEEGFRFGSHRFNSNEPWSLKVYKRDTQENYSSIYAKFHGTLMMLAWCILIPNGTFLARYFKESFVNVSIIFKCRVWFAGHLIFQLTGFLMCLAATGFIVRERSIVSFELPRDYTVALHFNLGVFAILFQAVQVFFGGVKWTGRKIRRAFAFGHLLVGAACYTVGLTAVSTTANLGMQCEVPRFVLILCVIYIVSHAIMTFHFHRTDKKLGLNYSRALYPFPIPPVTYDEVRGAGIRLGILGVHFALSTIVTGYMIFKYWTKKPCQKHF